MGRKVFISYKYSDYEQNHEKYRDKLIELLKDDGNIYNGEDGYSDDLTGYAADTIKERLKKMIHDTTVTIVLISQNITQSKWVDWEISYSLKDITRNDEGRSRMNGLIGVILPDNFGNDSYAFYRNECGTKFFTMDVLPEMIGKNLFNQIDKDKSLIKTKCGDAYNLNYCGYSSICTWKEFIDDIENKIEISFDKSRKYVDQYDIKKEQNQ